MDGPVYIAGPMTGKPEWNFPAFHAAAQRIRDAGFTVVNPAELDEEDALEPGARPWEWYLRRDLAALLKCNTVAVLPGWDESRGASLEVYVASTVGIDVVDADTLQDLDAPPETVLEEATRHVHGERRDDYGHPFDNHGRTAEYWSAYIGSDISPEDVCFLNILQKISRSRQRVTRDTLVDIAGYAANVEMVQNERRVRDWLADAAKLRAESQQENT